MARTNAAAADAESPYLTVDEVARLLRVTPRHVRDLCHRGHLDYVRAGSVKLLRITRTSVDRFLAGDDEVDVDDEA